MSVAKEQMKQTDGIDAIIDLERHPIHDLDGEAGQALIERCRAQLADDGCVVLKGFIRPEALAAIRDETRELAPRAHYNETHTNPYNSDGDPALPDNHPKNVFGDRTNGFVAGDLIAQDTAVRRVYHNPDFQRFIAAAMDEPELHEYADPLAGLVINVLRDGCQHPWHYDTNEFIVTMMTQRPEQGGDFEYCPQIRNPEDENFEGVQRVLEGDRSPIKTLSLEPGDLQIFYGRYSLHRVARVHGDVERHTVIFGYAREPGFIGRAERAKRIFGRMAPIHERQLEEGLERSDKLAD
ncbi:hypothetical protein KBTX_01871 [wastewater metagenome]|uniref:Fe2OG dioxygenase domain-containing protein n=3 Tax=root TaxID=1 RepID=A0A5B8RCC0_9ZZZZ|nr:hypothetical protein [Arhodomonas aquaeolei]MCS4504343.1 hypothetical protein [Arhodomonas aquaeolei]QEA05548.1 hypothetical protein KBTEX_01871 [uncultured organism]